MLGLSPVVEHGLGRFVPPDGDDNPFAWLTAQRIILAGVAAVQQQSAAAAGASATVSAAGWPAARLRPDAPLGPPQFTSTLDQLAVASFHPHHCEGVCPAACLPGRSILTNPVAAVSSPVNATKSVVTSPIIAAVLLSHSPPNAPVLGAAATVTVSVDGGGAVTDGGAVTMGDSDAVTMGGPPGAVGGPAGTVLRFVSVVVMSRPMVVGGVSRLSGARSAWVFRLSRD